MTIYIYPAKLVGENWEPAFPLGTGENTILKQMSQEDYTYTQADYYQNPEYVPYADINMSEGNLLSILNMFGITYAVDECCGHAKIEYVLEKTHAYLFARNRVRDMDQYVAERAFGLHTMATLGISRGCTHIVWG